MMKSFTPVAACLLTLTAAITALSQNNPEPPSVRLEVVISRFVGETKVASEPFLLLLKPGEKGSLAMEYKGAVDLDARKACPAPATQQTGTQLEATAMQKADGSFGVQLTITDRAFAGCRNVGTASIPVFTNRIIAKSVTLSNGETTHVDLAPGSVPNDAVKVDVTLTMK